MAGVGSLNSDSKRLNVELVNYRNAVDNIDEKYDLFEYWKGKFACYPGLSKVARIVHCIRGVGSTGATGAAAPGTFESWDQHIF